ncbi:unnamed protein product [Acanthoscelides obtectus]|uniref:Gag protein n=1 Tax=Acanthoscelides obtectus TaxID=200917 RepID=A0A9P0Q4B9_ACAOB|nr:unnamed protein product [Acanthoscelides obtectus]CAK1669437.1 hypothetical protein AOBTE_LOCUS27007 [Acanthoscelides obtectus]
MIDPAMDSDSTKARLEQATGLLDNFNTVQDEIEILSETELSSSERATFEDRYYSAIENAHRYTKASKQINTEPSSNVGLSHHQLHSVSNTRFPNIELPKFHGEYEKWGQFRDMFLALVDRDPTLDNVKKFYYLMSCLKGEAARVIENMEVTGENYDHAWQLLKSRYENSTVIIKNHVRELVEMPSVTRDPHSLRKLTDDLQKHLRSLTSLGEPVTQWSTLLIYLITKKLDPSSEKSWEEHVISRQIESPGIDDLIKFLNARCQLLEAISREKSDNPQAEHRIHRLTTRNL